LYSDGDEMSKKYGCTEIDCLFGDIPCKLLRQKYATCIRYELIERESEGFISREII
jgi:hypothetical protein